MAGVASLAILATPRAHAESPPRPCYRDAEVFPRTTGSIPAGAPALVFLPARFVSERPISAYALELRGPSGEIIAHTLEADGQAYLLRPVTALELGRYQVQYTDLCSYYSPTQKRTVEVKVEEAVALPTRVGDPRAGSAPAVRFKGIYEPKCQPAEVIINFVLDLSPEMAAYKEVVRYEVAYKGKSRTLFYGEAHAFDRSVRLEVEDSCNLRELVGGEVIVTAHVAGAASDPAPLRFQLTATCPGIGSEPKPPMDARPPLPTCGSTDGGSGSRDTGATGLDAGTAQDALAKRPSSNGGGGCHVASLPARGGFPWYLLLLMATLARSKIAAARSCLRTKPRRTPRV